MTDRKGIPVSGEVVRIFDKNREEVFSGETDEEGMLEVELEEFHVLGIDNYYSSPYTVVAGKNKRIVELDGNKEVRMVVR